MPQQASGEQGRRVVPATTRHTRTARARLAVILHIALRALTRHLLRSVLATLGISIGVGAFLCSVAVGQGAARQIEDHIRSLGENFIWIEAGNRNVNGVRTGTHGTQSLTFRDMRAIQQQIPLLAQISPNVDLRVQVYSATRIGPPRCAASPRRTGRSGAGAWPAGPSSRMRTWQPAGKSACLDRRW